MLLAASESAVTKKPRFLLTMRRSSSLRPFGSFQVAMSRDMFTSCGIQWFAHVARYFSHAHLYLNGTSWLTSVWPLMMRFSAAVTRRADFVACVAAIEIAGETCGSECGTARESTACVSTGADCTSRSDGEAVRPSRSNAGEAVGREFCGDRRSSSQTSMCVLPMALNYRSVVLKHQALIDSEALAMLLPRIEEKQIGSCASQHFE